MEKGHSGNWDVYRKNYKKLADFFNSTSLDNIGSVSVVMKPTIDKDLFLEYFSDNEKLYDYIKFLNEIYVEISELFSNQKIFWITTLPKPATPMTYSIEDACKLKQIIGNWLPTVRRYFNSLPKNSKRNLNLNRNLYTYIPTYEKNATIFPQLVPGCYKNIS